MDKSPNALTGSAGSSCMLVNAPAIQNGIERAKVSKKNTQGIFIEVEDIFYFLALY